MGMLMDRTGKGVVPHDIILDDQFLSLTYFKKPFNDRVILKKWNIEYPWNNNEFAGGLCDFTQTQPTWNDNVIAWAQKEFNIHDIGTSYFRLCPGNTIPPHRDLYLRYQELYGCGIDNIIRIVVFLQDWQHGHYLLVETDKDSPNHYDVIANYKKLHYIWWRGDTEHSAANIGTTPRYTLQITGHQSVET